MLGLGKANVKYKKWSPTWIPDLIGWFDFTDTGTMFQERDGTFVTPANSMSDPVGSIKNKATPTDPLKRLGDHLRASSDSERPTLYWHPGASLGNLGALFDGTDDHLIMEVEDPGGGGAVDYIGGVNSSTLSTSTIDHANATYLIIAKPTNADASADGCIMHITDYSTNNTYMKFEQENGGDEFRLTSFKFGVGVTTLDSTADMHPGGQINKHLVICADGRTDFYKNGSADGSNTSWVDEEDRTLAFGGDHACVLVGESYRGNAGNLNGANFAGYIYEILIYNRAITDSERDLLNRYMESKYPT